MLSGLPSVIGWVIIANAQYFQNSTFLAVLFIGRFLTGVAVGWVVFGISVSLSAVLATGVELRRIILHTIQPQLNCNSTVDTGSTNHI